MVSLTWYSVGRPYHFSSLHTREKEKTWKIIEMLIHSHILFSYYTHRHSHRIISAIEQGTQSLDDALIYAQSKAFRQKQNQLTTGQSEDNKKKATTSRTTTVASTNIGINHKHRHTSEKIVRCEYERVNRVTPLKNHKHTYKHSNQLAKKFNNIRACQIDRY